MKYLLLTTLLLAGCATNEVGIRTTMLDEICTPVEANKRFEGSYQVKKKVNKKEIMFNCILRPVK